MEKVYIGQAAVEMTGVTFRRPSSETPVLSGISLRIPEGQQLGIAGVNGSGKSTLLHLINGMLMADEGAVHIYGRQLTGDTIWDIRKQVGLVFANPDHQFVGQTVAEELAFGLENLQLTPDEMRERIERYAKLLRVEKYLCRHPSYLSGGQKQRVALAAVLAMEPQIILFDEAASMLDEGGKHEYLDLLKQTRAEKRYTLISVTHDTDELIECDRVILLAGGTVIGDGKPEDLLLQDDLMTLCRLKTPYMLQLCRELANQGIAIGEHFTRQEVLRELWTYASNMSFTATKEAGPSLLSV